MKNSLLYTLIIIPIFLFSQEIGHLHIKPGSHAPIGVMTDHTHNKGEWMFSYRYMYMNMEDLMNGSENLTFSSALENYNVTPTKMHMNMHMLGMMYAPTDKLTLSVMSSYLSSNMDHLTRMGSTFNTVSSGIGDTKVKGLYRLIHKPNSKLHTELGLSIPTGSIDKKDLTPISTPNEVILPYPMQIGSGTWDGIIGLTYLFEISKLNFGIQARSLLRMGTNSNEYRLGNRYKVNGWTSYNVNSWLSFSGRFEGESIGKIKGNNPTLNPQMIITADTSNSGGEILRGAMGLNIQFPKESLKGLRLGAEFVHPLYQNLNGIQLKTNESFLIGIQYSL